MSLYPRPPAWAAGIRTIGVTGTDGKTSTTRFCAAGLARASGEPVARMTTVDAGIGDELGPPPAEHDGFLALMAEHRRRGGSLAAVEATSVTLGLGFARAWPFEVGVFTNLGHDHMRSHGSPEHYLAAKAQLFLALPAGGAAVLNADDPRSALIAEIIPAGVRILWFAGPASQAIPAVGPIDLRVCAIASSWAGAELQLDARPELGLPSRLRLRSPAAFQAGNAAAALLACAALGFDPAAIAEGIAACPPPPGRFEPIPLPPGARGPRVVVDYAHTPEALRAALASGRALLDGEAAGGPGGRLLLVLGAGGDGDRRKRPELGAEASRGSDGIWVTSDNPRGEDPAMIAADIVAGIGPSRGARGPACTVELDRAAAIAAAIATADEGDLVILAGKGHERGQTIAGQTQPFFDPDHARAALERRARAAAGRARL